MSSPTAGHLMTLLGVQGGREIRPTFKAMCAFLYNMRVSASLANEDLPCPIVTSRKSREYTGTGIGYKPILRILNAALAVDPPLIISGGRRVGGEENGKFANRGLAYTCARAGIKCFCGPRNQSAPVAVCEKASNPKLFRICGWNCA